MTPAPHGNPPLQVRLSPEIQAKLRAVTGEREDGRAGGMSLFMRRLLYRELREPVPTKWGQASAGMEELFLLSERVQEHEDAVTDSTPQLIESLANMAIGEPDIIRRNFARQLLGELAAKLYRTGSLALSSGDFPPGVDR